MKRKLLMPFLALALLFSCKPDVVTYSLEFDPNGGIGIMESIKVEKGESVSLPLNTFDGQGKDFKGWATSSTGEVEYNNGASYTPTSDAVLYAVWTLPGDFGEGHRSMIFVQGGTFIMGSDFDMQYFSDEMPMHEVTLSSYYISKYEITQGLFEEIMGYNPAKTQPAEGVSYKELPVETVTWYEAAEFCNKLSEDEGLQPVYTIYKDIKDPENISDIDQMKWLIEYDFSKNGYRLPTEAEWEFAARGGIESQGYLYSGSNDIEEVAWRGANCNHTPQPVGTKKANELGIHDMTGNVNEWCWDWFGLYTEDAKVDPINVDPYTPNGLHFMVRCLRGGAAIQFETVESYRTTRRMRIDGDFNLQADIGFRMVRRL